MASCSISPSSGSQHSTEAVLRPAALAAARNEFAPPSGASGVLSTSRCTSAATPRNIEAWAGTVIGGTIVVAVKQAPPERASAHRFGIVAGEMARGASPSTEITSSRSSAVAGTTRTLLVVLGEGGGRPVERLGSNDDVAAHRVALPLGIDLTTSGGVEGGVGLGDRLGCGLDLA